MRQLQSRILDPLGMTSTSLGSNGLTRPATGRVPTAAAARLVFRSTVKEPYYQRARRRRRQFQHQRSCQVDDRPDGRTARSAVPAVLDEAHRKRISTPVGKSRVSAR